MSASILLALDARARRELRDAVSRYIDDVHVMRLTSSKSATGLHALFDASTARMIDVREQLDAYIALDDATETRSKSTERIGA